MFSGKIAVVTGGSSGIGATIAQQLAIRGARVAVVASSSIDKAGQVIASWGDAAASGRPYAADVSDSNAVQMLFKQVEADLGGVDLLVNAAGIYLPTPSGETAPAESSRMIDINVKGTWNCIEAAVPLLRRRGGGRILNFASVAGTIGVRQFSLYCATKAAILMMTRALAAELARDGININAIAPGNTSTPMNEPLRSGEGAAERIAAMASITPSGVAFTEPEEMAEIALFMLSDAARPVHGATWVVDEGISAAIG